MSEPVAYVLRIYDPDTDTHLRYHYEMIRELQRRGHKVIPVFQQMRGEWEGAVCCRFSNKTLGVLEMIVRVLLLRLSGVKKFYTHYVYHAGVAAGVVARLFGGTSYFWNCGMTWRLHGVKQGLTRVKELLTIQLPFRLALALSQELITCTPRMAQFYKSHYNLTEKSISVVPNWVDLERFSIDRAHARRQLGWDTDERIILFVHRLSERKGAHRLPRIAEALQNATLVVVGDGPLLHFLQEKAENLPIRVIGRVPNERIPLYMAAADLYIMPSREEGFGRTAIEAMAAGTPVLATPVGGVPDVVPDERSLSAADEFPSRIQALLETAPKTQEMSRTARKHVGTQFSLSVAANALEKVFWGPDK